MSMRSRFTVSFAVAAAAASLAMAPAGAAADTSFTPVRVNPTLQVVPGSFAALDRGDSRVAVFVHDTQLAPATTYQEAFVVFNNPAACTNPTPASRCTPGQDFTPSTAWGLIPVRSTFTTDAAGRANFVAILTTRDAPLAGGFLTNPQGAEVALAYKPVNHGAGAQHILISDPRPDHDSDGGRDD